MTKEIISIFAILIGIICCFFGYKVQKILITIVWFTLGFTLSNKIGTYVIDSQNLLWLIDIIIGVIIARIGFKLEKLALFIAISYVTFITMGPYIKGVEEGLSFIITGSISLMIGAFSLFIMKPILIIISSIAGANLIKIYLPSLITIPANILIIFIIVLAIFGVIVQFKTN